MNDDQPILRSATTVARFLEVIDAIEPVTGAGLWFRGQADASYRLTPGVLRDTETLTDGRGRPVRPGQVVRSRGGAVGGPSPERMLAAFKRQARPFVEGVPANDFEWMFIAQHHGLQTRLLDWSTNALAALFFAASDAASDAGSGADDRGEAACSEFEAGDEHRTDGFAVFVIDPGDINAAAGHGDEPIDIAADPGTWAHYLDPMSAGLSAYAPICVIAPHVSPRIRAQSGTFTLHGSNIDPIDYYTALRPRIVKIFFPCTSTAVILESLVRLGINNSFIYPGLESVARDVNVTELARYRFDRSRAPVEDD